MQTFFCIFVGERYMFLFFPFEDTRHYLLVICSREGLRCALKRRLFHLSFCRHCLCIVCVLLRRDFGFRGNARGRRRCKEAKKLCNTRQPGLMGHINKNTEDSRFLAARVRRLSPVGENSFKFIALQLHYHSPRGAFWP